MAPVHIAIAQWLVLIIFTLNLLTAVIFHGKPRVDHTTKEPYKYNAVATFFKIAFFIGVLYVAGTFKGLVP